MYNGSVGYGRASKPTNTTIRAAQVMRKPWGLVYLTTFEHPCHQIGQYVQSCVKF